MIIQIVPQLPPIASGVGDYALVLARQIRQDFGILTCFIVGDPNWSGADDIEGFPVKKIAKRSGKNLISTLAEVTPDPIPVLLHYVNYGYDRRGCPIWLINGLRRWQEKSKSRLLTMFHEIYAGSKLFWTSAFWTEPLQKHLAASIANISDRLITSKPLYGKLLHNLCQNKTLQIPIIPVFSNIGEPQKRLPLTERKQRLVVFGGSGNRLKVYEESISPLSRICQELNIQEVIDIGPPINLPISEVGDIPIVKLGQQSADKVSALLQDSLVGFFYYPLDFLSRSTIFAAYCAHGVIPVGTGYYVWGQEDDGIEVNQHYWLANNQTGDLTLGVGQMIANQAYAWYQNHNLSKQAEVFINQLFHESLY
ncbi:MAG: glycosyltransferase family 1 protein [Nostocaceae cyanobacterium]|nr:glycosyltransferase family 1 protein [Nostocaceae cyanobacterium]